jgi:hypothetical protein
MYQYTPLTAEHPVLWSPPSQEQLGKKAIQLRIAPPTPLHEDQLNMHLAVLGLTQVTDSDIRATIISELFTIYENEDRPDDEAEADANLLDAVWQKSQIYQELVSDWAMRDRQRRIDLAAGTPEEKLPYEPMPEALSSARESARHKILIREISNKSVLVRKLTAEKSMAGSYANALMIKMHVLPVADNFEFQDGRNDLGILSDNDVSRLKQQMSLADFDNLVNYVDGLYSFSKDEEGNSSLPSESGSDQIGSIEPNEDLGNSGGNLMASNTGPAPITGSEETTKNSSTST